MNKPKRKKPLLPFVVIESAASGDIGAINKVLKHYEGYIAALSIRPQIDNYGNAYFYVDEEIKRILETKLILKIMQFDVKQAA